MQMFIQKNLWSDIKPLVSVLDYTTKTGSSLRLFLETPLLPCVMKIVQPWLHRTNPAPLQMLQEIKGGVVQGLDRVD